MTKLVKPSSICTLATSNAKNDLKIFIYSVRLFEPNIPILVLCDSKIPELLVRFKKDKNLYLFPQLDKYSNKNREIMERDGIWTEFMLRKCDIIDIDSQEDWIKAEKKCGE